MIQNKLRSLLFVLSLVCFLYVGFLVSEQYTPSSPIVVMASDNEIGFRTIQIPSQNINLNIETKLYNIRSLPLSKAGAVSLKSTNIIYAHNWPNLFGKLKFVKINDEIIVNSIRKYSVYSIEEIGSKRLIEATTSDSEIVLYTCSGFLDSKRLIVKAKKA